MRQGDLAGPRRVASADQRGHRGAVVRRAQGPPGPLRGVEASGRRCDAGALHRLVVVQGRQQSRQAARQQGFAAAWRPDHQDRVRAGGGYLQRALGQLMAPDIAQIGQPARGAGGRAVVDARQRLGSAKVGAHIAERGRGQGMAVAD